MTSFDHVNIVVFDMERSVAFYRNVLGLAPGFTATLEGDWIERVTGHSNVHARCVFMEAAGSSVRLELLQYISPLGETFSANGLPSTAGLRHLAFTVDDMGGLLARLEAAGIRPLSTPVEVPFAVGALGRKRLCYFHDPDGVLLEAAAYG